MLLFVVPANRKPAEASVWLLLIFALAMVGVLAFCALGSPKLSRLRRSLQRSINAYIGDHVARSTADPLLAPIVGPLVPERYQPFVRLGTAFGAVPPVAGKAVEVLVDYQGILARMAHDVDAAPRFVHGEFFILIGDGTTEVLMAVRELAVAQGVTVKLRLYRAPSVLHIKTMTVDDDIAVIGSATSAYAHSN